MDVIELGLRSGGWLCVFMTTLIGLSLRQNPRIWLHAAPRDVQERLGPIDARTARQKKVWSVVMGVGLVVIFTDLARRAGSGGAGEVFVAALVAFQTFNLFDAVVIDLGLVTLRPAWALPPDAWSPSYLEPRWHLRNWLVGVAGGFPFAAMVAGLSWILAG